MHGQPPRCGLAIHAFRIDHPAVRLRADCQLRSTFLDIQVSKSIITQYRVFLQTVRKSQISHNRQALIGVGCGEAVGGTSDD
jgi:hypothetical protein